MLSLFPDPPGESQEFRDRLAERLRKLADNRIFIGTSSWKYPGWLGQIYSPERYRGRGRFSKKRFQDSCLAEYAEVFPAVGADFSFYQFPTAEYWERLFESAPETLLFSFKAPENITVRSWPKHPRYGERAGQTNHDYLNSELFEEEFLRYLAPRKKQVAPIIFEFGQAPRYADPGPEAFREDLDSFLSALPKAFQYSVEIRTPHFLTPDYLARLHNHNVSHVLNAWSRMPTLSEQLELPGVLTADFVLVRALLQAGRKYEEAVRLFQPYGHVREPDPAGRAALRRIIEEARADRKSAFIYVNNRFEGNAPETVWSIIEDL